MNRRPHLVTTLVTAVSDRVVSIEAFRLQVPLSHPYHLSFGTLTAFDSVLVCVSTADAEGWGETTPLPGYSRENADTVWDALVAWSNALPGASLTGILASLRPYIPVSPFACAALSTACETLASLRAGMTAVRPAAHECIRLIGTIRSATADRIEREVPDLVRAGYGTLKLKVGTDLSIDLANVRAAQRALGGVGHLRIDANQGYTFEQARAFLERMDPAGIELFEQPFPPQRWDWMGALGARTPVPLMLDESIESEEDVDRAAATPGVRYVKFKLMKAGSIERLRQLLSRAARLGLGIVVGNGVAGDLGCLHEAWTVAGGLSLPGEMNGFLKPVDSLLAEPIQVRDGAMILPRLESVEIERNRIRQYCVRSHAA